MRYFSEAQSRLLIERPDKSFVDLHWRVAIAPSGHRCIAAVLLYDSALGRWFDGLSEIPQRFHAAVMDLLRRAGDIGPLRRIA